MSYVDGFVVPVPTAKKDDYRRIAETAASVFKAHGALSVVECWGDDVPEGQVTDFRKSVQAGADEAVVFSWVEWPDKATRVEGWARFMADERMTSDQNPMPFDGQRMFWGGFEVIVDSKAGIGAEAAEREPA